MFACVYVPDFPVEAIVRSEPLLREKAIAILDGKPPQVRVVALNDKARMTGMDAGMTKLQAAIFTEDPALDNTASEGPRNKPGHIGVASEVRSSSREVVVMRQRSLEQEKSAHGALLDVAHAFTPRVEDTAHDRLVLDLEGLERLYGTELKMAHELSIRVSRTGLETSIGIAANPDAAMHAACGFSGITVIPAGEEARRLGVLPLTILLDCFDLPERAEAAKSAAGRQREKLRAQMLDTLERWGVRDFRTLSLLPEHALAARLGETGARLQRLACGAETRTIALCEPKLHFEEALELESPVETLEPLSFVLNRLLEQLCQRLESRALAAQEVQIRLQLERCVADEETTTAKELFGIPESHDVRPTAMYQRTLRLPVAMRDSKVLLKLLQLELAAHPPGAPITKLWIAAQPASPRSAQRGLFLPLTPEAEKLEITLARISGIVGECRAGIARILDTHRHDGFVMERFVSTQDGTAPISSTTMSEVAPFALRIFRPPSRLQVQMADDRPSAVSSFVPKPDNAELQGKVLWAAGPWRSSGDWWTSREDGKQETGPWDREEWDIALMNGSQNSIALFRIYRDLATGHWFADASYD